MSQSDGVSGGDGDPQAPQNRNHKRILRAVFAADIAGFSSKMSLNETSAVTSLNEIRTIGLAELETYNGWLFGMPGDGFFALFESAVGAVQCGLEIQRVLSGRPHLGDMPMRIGIHLGELLMDEGLPYGETLNIAARLEALCQPGEMLVSGPVMDAVSARVSATFEARGVPRLKNIPRRIATFAVKQPPARTPTDQREPPGSSLDQTTRLDRDALRRILDEQSIVQIVKRDPPPAPTSVPGVASEQSPAASDADAVPYDPAALEPTASDRAADARSGGQIGFPVPIAQSTLEAQDEAGPESAPPLEAGSIDQQAASTESEPIGQNAFDELSQMAIEAEDEAGDGAKHVPLQVPDFDPELQGDFNALPEQPSAKCIEMITKALAVHIGPLSKLIVDRYMKGKPNVYDLIGLLETHIPDDDEKTIFRVRASHICKTFGHSPDA